MAGGCCEPLVEPDLGAADSIAMAGKFKALADPTRLRIIDALRKGDPDRVESIVRMHAMKNVQKVADLA